jgi:hypothetical protein
VVLIVEGHGEIAAVQVRLRLLIFCIMGLVRGRLAFIILQAEADETVGDALRVTQSMVETFLIELDLAHALLFIHTLNLRSR